MCDPLTLAGAAATIASTGVNYAANQKVEAARNDALAAERIRQNGLDKEAAALNADARGNYKNVDKQEAKSSKKLGDYFKGQDVPEPAAASALPVSASNVTVSEENKQRGKATDFTNRTGAALGELRSFGDVLAENGLLQARDASEVGQIGGFKTGSSNVLGYELDHANSAGNGLKLFGDILGGAGSLALTKGLSGSPAAAASSFKPTTTMGSYIGGSTLPSNSMAIGRLFDKTSMPGYAR